MATSLLYYRTDTTTKFGTGAIDDPRDLLIDHSAQVLEFTQPDNVLEGITEVYENITTKVPSVNQSGTRRIFTRDDGAKMRDFSIVGRLDKENEETSVNKIKQFRTQLMRTNLHPHGNIGFLSGNAPFFSIDPDATRGANNNASTPANRGLMIGSTTIGNTGRLFRRLTFKMTLVFGGTHETVTVTEDEET